MRSADTGAGFLSRFAQRAAVYPLGDRLRDSQDAIPSAARPLSDPFGDARLMLNNLPDELAGEVPHVRQLGDRIVALRKRLVDSN